MSKTARFDDETLDAIRKAKILGVRSGPEHRYTGVWVVVVDGRAFVRSWNDKPTGWFHAFRHDPDGTVQVGEIEIEVRARVIRSARLQRAVTAAFGEKYHTPGSRNWVTGFAESEREMTTLEFIPR
jgi:hypothetical protein